jgi:hypothetical protein
VTLNERWRVAFSPAPGWRRYHLAIPPDLAGATELRIDLHAPTRVPMRENPQSDDARSLSVMLHRVAVVP